VFWEVRNYVEDNKAFIDKMTVMVKEIGGFTLDNNEDVSVALNHFIPNATKSCPGSYSFTKVSEAIEEYKKFYIRKRDPLGSALKLLKDKLLELSGALVGFAKAVSGEQGV
jgi:hypothetical protein